MAGDTGRPDAVVFAVYPPIGRADLGTECDRLADLLRGGAVRTVVVDLAAFTEPDVVVVELVARLQLTAARLGGRIGLVGVGRRLLQLLTLTGLHTVVAMSSGPQTGTGSPGSGVEGGRQAEQREQVLGVEE